VKNLILLSWIFLLLLSCRTSHVDRIAVDPGKTTGSNGNAGREMAIKIFSVCLDSSNNLVIKSKGYGYDIYVNRKRYIHQPFIPVISGNIPFHSRKDARKTAGFVIIKIRNNILPPSLTQAELDSLRVIR